MTDKDREARFGERQRDFQPVEADAEIREKLASLGYAVSTDEQIIEAAVQAYAIPHNDARALVFGEAPRYLPEPKKEGS